jgi:hypothetical protein
MNKSTPKIAKHKYRANPTTVDGIRFASAKEARRYSELKLLVRAGKITELRLQPKFKLVIEETYIADFEYIENGKLVVEDVKGFLTGTYRRKRRAMKKQHGIEIKET